MAAQYVIEVTTATFQRDVIEKSHSVPVLVDFWSSQCSPCLVLGPILEKVVSDYGGRAILAKVDVDSSPDLAGQYMVRGIPAVKLFVDGEVSAEFAGAVPESQVREFLQQAIPSPEMELVTRAEELREKGNLDEAESLAKQALQESPEDERALEITAVAAMASGRVDEALNLVNRMEAPSKDMQFLTEGVEFWRMCEKAADERKTSDVPPDNLDGKISHAACLASEGELVQALNVLLEVLETDKSFREGLARKATVSIFVVMGLTNPVVKEYQSRLAQLLF